MFFTSAIQDPPVPFSQNVLKTFILIGQSNMEGAYTTGTIPAQYLPSMVNLSRTVYNYRTNNNNISGPVSEILPLQFGVNNNWRNGNLNTCGPELSFARDVAFAINQDVMIIKYSLGGSAMTDTGSVFTNGYWQWDATNNPANTGDTTSGRHHYDILINFYIIPAIQQMQALGFTLDFKFLLIDQGEADMSAPNSTIADAWGTTYISLFNKIKSVIAPYNASISNLKSCIFKTGGPNYTNVINRPYYTNVQISQENANTALGGVIISKSSLTTGADGIHETRDQQIIKGSMAATAIVPYL